MSPRSTGRRDVPRNVPMSLHHNDVIEFDPSHCNRLSDGLTLLTHHRGTAGVLFRPSWNKEQIV
jgi:hypothetical protein